MNFRNLGRPVTVKVIPNANWVIPCCLAVGGMPMNETVFHQLLDEGFTTFISLIEEKEIKKFKHYDYRTSPRFGQIEYISLPTRDESVADLDSVQTLCHDILRRVDGSIFEGTKERIYLHCRGGHGRSAYIAIATLILFMRNSDPAVQVEIRRLLNLSSFETEEVINYFRREKLTRTVKARKESVTSSEQRGYISRIVEDSPPTIFFYHEKDITDPSKGRYGYGEFSNFYEGTKNTPMELVVPLDYHFPNEEMVTVKSSEHWFQAQKFLGPDRTEESIEYARLLLLASTPNKAANMGRQVVKGSYSNKWNVSKDAGEFSGSGGFARAVKHYKQAGVRLRDDWDEVKDEMMYYIVSVKFTDNEELKELLLSTYPYVLQEYTHRDLYWAAYGGLGRNMLGQTLMRVRGELMS